ncbi:hypothetical protein [Treponema sp. UBA7567]|uniref:hypothetical protein n=1 Tax=Treponema sp. UBA7567 TaxID=1947748 RepID=UPI0025EA9FE2|nr:hypothetical protein [Treponema sp. UBA7567]
MLFPIVTFFKACSDYKKLGFEYLKSRFLIVLFGALSGCALCAIFEFCIFVPEYQGTDAAFFFLLQWIFSFFIPSLFFVFFILWSNDEWRVRIDGFLYFFLPFLCVYVPFWLFTKNAELSFFMLFVLPVMFLFEVFALETDVKAFYLNLKNKSVKCVLNVFLILDESVFASLVLTLYYFDFDWWIRGSACGVFAVLCLFRFCFKVKK